MMRRDQLAECNTDRQPLDEFQAGWCGRCVNPECTRSLYGQTRFDLRVNSWEERLFRNPPRMDPSDPRYRDIAGKRFLTVDVGPAPEIRSWVDPLQAAPEPTGMVVVPTPTPIPKPAPLPETAPVSLEVVGNPEPPSPPPVPVVSSQPTPPVPVVPPQEERRSEFFPLNTIPQGGRMLSGVKKEERPARDPWAVPEVAENVIPVGGRVRLGRSGV